VEFDPVKEYKARAATLAEMVQAQRAHIEAMPDCGGAPLCVGAEELIALGAIIKLHPSYPVSLALAAVGELRLAQDKVLDLEARLAAAEAELTTWQDAAEVLGPVGVPVEQS
jgi:hypothetical protein